MELKYAIAGDKANKRTSFNRTFMELKFSVSSEQLSLCSFNRTFMELKYSYRQADNPQGKVLIVPLWN